MSIDTAANITLPFVAREVLPVMRRAVTKEKATLAAGAGAGVPSRDAAKVKWGVIWRHPLQRATIRAGAISWSPTAVMPTLPLRGNSLQRIRFRRVRSPWRLC